MEKEIQYRNDKLGTKTLLLELHTKFYPINKNLNFFPIQQTFFFRFKSIDSKSYSSSSKSLSLRTDYGLEETLW